MVQGIQLNISVTFFFSFGEYFFFWTDYSIKKHVHLVCYLNLSIIQTPYKILKHRFSLFFIFQILCRQYVWTMFADQILQRFAGTHAAITTQNYIWF